MKENDGRLYFLDTNLFFFVFFFEKKKFFFFSVYWKNTFSGAYTNFNNFITETYETGLIA